VSIVRFASNRIDNGANEAQGGFGIKDIDPRGGRIWNDEHVGGVDHFPAAYARAVEPKSVRKNLLVIFGKGGGEMLPRAWQIGEFEIHNLYAVVFDHFADVRWSFVFGHGVR